MVSADVFRITVPADAAALPSDSGRLTLFLIHQDARRIGGEPPIGAPFFDDPQPVASVAVNDVRPGSVIEIGSDAVSWPVPLSELDGPYRVQAVLRVNPTSAVHTAPGNRFSAEREVELSSTEDEIIELAVTETFRDTVHTNPDPQFGDRLVWVEMPSERLSAFFGREVSLRAGVALPPDFGSNARGDRRWPALYIVPGFGGRHDGARAYARMLKTRNVMEITPNAVYIVLDPEGPFGHHGFADSACNGPVGEALVRELIPQLEIAFNLVSAPEARLINGHSSGAWSAIWLTLNHPETFGACWASSPDPIDFTAFQMTDLYADRSAFESDSGELTPSYRVGIAPRVDVTRMTVRQEVGVEHAMAPLGDSGQQWGAWHAIFSDRVPGKRTPRWAFDPISGIIDRDVIDREWSRYDIARMVLSRWSEMEPLLGRLRIAVGTQDSYFLNRSVARFQERVAARSAVVAPDGLPATPPPNAPTPVKPAQSAAPGGEGSGPADDAEGAPLGTVGGESPLVDGPGYIWFVKFATHDTIVPLTTLRWNGEMMEHLKAHQLD